jgi:hypothetical protein
MKNKILSLLFILIPSLVFPLGKEGEDLQTINLLIASTERQLSVHKQLHALMLEFQQQQDLFIDSDKPKELAREMVETAAKILSLAEEHQLIYLFTPFYVEELKFFAGISKKKAL